MATANHQKVRQEEGKTIPKYHKQPSNDRTNVLYQLTGEICPVSVTGDNFQNLTLPGEILKQI